MNVPQLLRVHVLYMTLVFTIVTAEVFAFDVVVRLTNVFKMSIILPEYFLVKMSELISHHTFYKA